MSEGRALLVILDAAGNLVEVRGDSQGRILVLPGAPSGPPTLYNVTLALANTEYSQALSANTKYFGFQARTAVDLRYAFVTGRVAAPTAPFNTVKSAAYWYTTILSGSGVITLYLASATAGTVVEIEEWI